MSQCGPNVVSFTRPRPWRHVMSSRAVAVESGASSPTKHAPALHPERAVPRSTASRMACQNGVSSRVAARYDGLPPEKKIMDGLASSSISTSRNASSRVLRSTTRAWTPIAL